ncbi:MAG: bifunctional folylpolyglutamate synthase/dihydrofolate synthase [Chloroflexia bacterium]
MSDYSDALGYLYSFTDLERVPGMATASGLDLAKVHRFFDLIGRPETGFRSVIVAGTKGKGSTANYLAGALRASGYRTGLYTQPHLTTFRERMQIDGSLLPPDRLVALVDWVRPYVEQMSADPPTTYEISTALALRYFWEERVDYAVLEIGLGGRLDAVNAVRAPLVSVITSLSLDHTLVLGDTIDKIAAEKAGIIRPGTPVVSAPQPADGLAVVEHTAAVRGSPLYLVGTDITLADGPPPEAMCGPGCYGRPLRATQAVTLTVGPRLREAAPQMPQSLPLVLPLLGRRQAANAAVACATCLLLAGSGAERLTPEAIRSGFRSVAWPGRLEVAGERPLLVLDGAHNGDSAEQLAADLPKNFCYRRLVLLLGAMADKQIDAILRPLLPLADAAVFTHGHHPRAMEPRALIERTEAIAARPGAYHAAEDVNAALALAYTLADPDDAILVTGSLYIVGEARAALGLGAPPDEAL